MSTTTILSESDLDRIHSFTIALAKNAGEMILEGSSKRNQQGATLGQPEIKKNRVDRKSCILLPFCHFRREAFFSRVEIRKWGKGTNTLGGCQEADSGCVPDIVHLIFVCDEKSSEASLIETKSLKTDSLILFRNVSCSRYGSRSSS